MKLSSNYFNPCGSNKPLFKGICREYSDKIPKKELWHMYLPKGNFPQGLAFIDSGGNALKVGIWKTLKHPPPVTKKNLEKTSKKLYQGLFSIKNCSLSEKNLVIDIHNNNITLIYGTGPYPKKRTVNYFHIDDNKLPKLKKLYNHTELQAFEASLKADITNALSKKWLKKARGRYFITQKTPVLKALRSNFDLLHTDTLQDLLSKEGLTELKEQLQSKTKKEQKQALKTLFILKILLEVFERPNIEVRSARNRTDVQYKRIPLKNGKSIGLHGRLNKSARKIQRSAAKQAKKMLKKARIAKNNIYARATAGLRDASNGEKLAKWIRNKLNIPLHIISGEEEALFVYKSTLTGEGIQPNEHALVIEIGGGSTEVALGTGPKPKALNHVSVLNIGTSRLNISNPFDFKHLKEKEQVIKHIINQELPPSFMTLAKGYRPFIKQQSFEYLQHIHKKQPFHGLPSNLYKEPLSLDAIKAYLSPQGLTYLKTHLQKDKVSQFEQKKLIGKLLTLKVLLEKIHHSQIELGFSGGLKFALLHQLMTQKLKTQASSASA